MARAVNNFLRNDEGAYDARCPIGHKSLIYLRNPKFDLLFESRANALLNGYLVRGVASFAVALERFQVFYIRAVCEN